jgi:hypothetical protein
MFALVQTFVVVALSGLALAIPAPTKTTPFEKRAISGVTAADCDGRLSCYWFRFELDL